MYFIKSIVKVFYCIIIFSLFSCYSSPENIDDLMDYSDNTKTYNIGISIFNKNIKMLKKNIFDEIIKNDGKIIQEEIQNINYHRILINIPKNKNIWIYSIIGFNTPLLAAGILYY
jgi:hypothetical protein